MSRKRIIFYLLFVIIFIAMLTAPRHDQFNQYLYRNGNFAGACIGATRHSSYTIFTLDYIDYCETDKQDTAAVFPVIKERHTVRYLGLFGKFWKL